MELDIIHVMINASNLDAARDFYISKLGLPVLEDGKGLFAFRAGGVRVSVFGGGKKLDVEKDEDSNVKIILRTKNVDADVKTLTAKGVNFAGAIQEAPNFMRFATMLDPDNNAVFLAQYLGDPFAPKH